MDDVQFRALDEALTSKNLDEFYSSPASLIERFLASLDNEAANQEGVFVKLTDNEKLWPIFGRKLKIDRTWQNNTDFFLFLDRLNRQMLSPGPSEMSEFSVAADRDLGDQTVDNMEKLQGDLKELKTDVKSFYDDFGKYFDERKKWITGTDYSKEIYRSVVVVPSSSSDTASMISSCKSSPPTTRSRKRFTTYSLKLPEKKKKAKKIKPLIQDSGFGAGTSR